MFLVVGQLLLVAAPVWAAEAEREEAGIPISELYWAINFLILFGVLVYFLRKPTKEFFASRARLLQTNVSQAKELKSHAEQKYSEYENRLRNIEREMQALVDSLKKDGELERRRLVQTAQEQITSLKINSEKILTQEVRKAKENLKKETVQLVMGLAEDSLRKNLTPQDQGKMVEQYLEKMEKLG